MSLVFINYRLAAQTAGKTVKASPTSSSPAAAAPKTELSKEFMVLGKKAFGALDRLNEHLLDTRTVETHGYTLALSDEKQSWVLRATTAETACDDLQAAAETVHEKLVAGEVKETLLALQRIHNMIDTTTEAAIQSWNNHIANMQIDHSDPIFYGIPTEVPEARDNAVRIAADQSKAILSLPCYLATKDAVTTGMLTQCRSPENNAAPLPTVVAPILSPYTPEQNYVNGLKLTDGSTARAEGHAFIVAMHLPDSMSADEFAAMFQQKALPQMHNLTSAGFTQVRLEVGGKTFAWPLL